MWSIQWMQMICRLRYGAFAITWILSGIILLLKKNLHLLRVNITPALALMEPLKTKQLDDFYRDWPNIIIADDKTIASVDEKWSNLGLGDFIPSPSLKFKDQMYGEEAVVNIIS